LLVTLDISLDTLSQMTKRVYRGEPIFAGFTERFKQLVIKHQRRFARRFDDSTPEVRAILTCPCEKFVPVVYVVEFLQRTRLGFLKHIGSVIRK